ncbi:MAG: hypothetical protein LAQ69_08400 [Acidobacteriia bacterium]|nr:hypothetical protein [Terriglobia bacterium]
MTSRIRSLVLTTSFAGILFAEDIVIPLEHGSIVIQDPAFIRVNKYGDFVPELSYRIVNRTLYSWTTVKLQFEISGSCDGSPRHWSATEVGSVGSSDDPATPFIQNFRDQIIPLVGKVNGCSAVISGVKLLLAENANFRIDGVTGERIDFAKRAAAAALARRKRESEQKARLAKDKAERDESAAIERAAIRAKCTTIYQHTAQKKVSDLTVEETRQIGACAALDLYPPR